MPKKTSIPPVPNEVHVLADQIGDFIQYWGFRKTEGKLWTYLFLSDQPLNAEELMERTQISKAMLSLALGELIKYDVIRKAYPDRKRNQAHVINPNVIEVINNVLRTRERQLLGKIFSSYLCTQEVSLKGESPKLSHERVEFLGQMISAAMSLLDSFLSLKELNMFPFQQVQFAPSLVKVPEKRVSTSRE
jgi:DNA-binding transcriptional regulator GbsR (MarR family)